MAIISTLRPVGQLAGGSTPGARGWRAWAGGAGQATQVGQLASGTGSIIQESVSWKQHQARSSRTTGRRRAVQIGSTRPGFKFEETSAAT